MNAYREGYAAGNSGRDKSENPYRGRDAWNGAADRLAEQWDEGYSEGKYGAGDGRAS